jgi:hypothetical protein
MPPKIGLLTQLLGGKQLEWRQTNAINQLQSQIARVSVDGQSVGMLFELDRVQGEEIARLRATVNVLVDLLVETGALNEEILSDRLRAALQAATPPAPPADPDAQQITCAACGRGVTVAEAARGVAGVVCHDCFGAGR